MGQRLTTETREYIDSQIDAKVRLRSTNTSASSISDAAISQFVTRLLLDKAANMSMVPDFAEHALYTSILKAALLSLKESSEGSSLEFAGHRLTFSISPINNTTIV